MADKELHELTSWTPALTDITVFWWPAGWAEVKKSTFSSIKDLLKTSYDALYQAILVSGTNIKTLNGNSILWSGNLALPVLSDWNYTDATISSSGTVITINNGVVTNAKLANVASATFKGRTTVGTGSPEDMTATQATALLNTATTSLKGLLPASGWGTTNFLRADLTWTNPNEWTLLTSSSYTAWGTYDSWTLTTYDLYKIVISGTSSWSNTFLWLRLNNDASPSTYVTYSYNTGSTSLSSSSDWYYQILYHNSGIWWPFYWEYVMTGRDTALIWSSFAPISVGQTLAWGYKPIAVTSIQLSTIIAISGNIKIYGKNY